MWWAFSLLFVFTYAHVARYISGLRDNVCIEEKKNKPFLALCDVSKNTQLIETLDASITKIQFESGRCLSIGGDLVDCSQATTFELAPYVWGTKVYLRISVNGTVCLTNPRLTIEPCQPYPLENRSQLFIAFQTGAHENESELALKDADWAFQQSNFLNFNLQFSVTQQKAQMAVNPLSEAYLPSVITVQYGSNESVRYEGVGLRYKGSLGSFGLCIDPMTRTINDVCRRLSLKVDTNKFIKKMKQSVFGLKKLIFNGMAIDYSLMAERVAFKAFQTVGVMAPRAVHATIYLNNNLSGVYVWVEAIDDVFTMKHFGDDNNGGRGGLYKDAWLRGVRPGDYSSSWAKGIDEDEFLAEAAQAVFEARDDEAISVLEKYFDTESIVSVTAMNAVLGMTDDWRWRHNFWWYVRDYSLPSARNKKLVMLPWDYDRTNDESWLERVKQGPWWDVWDPNDPRCLVNQSSLGLSNDTSTQWFWNVLNMMLPSDYYRPIQCDKLTRLFALALKKRVQARTAQYADLITMDRIKAWMDEWSAQIQPIVFKENAKPSIEQWTLAKAGLLFHYMTARAVAGYEKVGALTGGLNSLGLSLETLIRETGGDLQRLISLGQAKATPPTATLRPTLPTNRPSVAPFRLSSPTLPPFLVPSSPSTRAFSSPTAPSFASVPQSALSPTPRPFSSTVPAFSSPTLSSFFSPTAPAVSTPAVRPFSPAAPTVSTPAVRPFSPPTSFPTPITSIFSSPTPLTFSSPTPLTFSSPTPLTFSSSSTFTSPTTSSFTSPTAPPFSSLSSSSTTAAAATSSSSLPSFWLPPSPPIPPSFRSPTPISFPSFVAPVALVTPVTAQLFLLQQSPDFRVSGPIIVPAGTSLAALGILPPGFQGPLPYNASTTSPFSVSGLPQFNFPSSAPMVTPG